MIDDGTFFNNKLVLASWFDFIRCEIWILVVNGLSTILVSKKSGWGDNLKIPVKIYIEYFMIHYLDNKDQFY